MTHQHPDGAGHEPVDTTAQIQPFDPVRPGTPPAGHLSPLSAGATATVWSVRTLAAVAVTAVALSGLGGAGPTT